MYHVAAAARVITIARTVTEIHHMRMTRRPLGLAAVLLFAGGAGAQSVLFTVHGDNASDTAGQSVDVVGDVNGDGFDDVMVGAWRDDNTGADAGSVRVVSGKTGATLFVINGDVAGDHMGFGSSGAGDVNGDGFADVCAAADEANVGGMSNIGSAKIVSGQTGNVLFTVTGTNAADLFGWSSAAAGDVNGDGFGDVIIGALNDDTTGLTNCGSATVISGQGGVLFTFFGGAASDNLGDSVGAAGDTNGDGFLDLIAGAPNADPNGSASGRATVFSGKDGSILRQIDGDSAGDRLGDSVDGAGDVDLDGFADLVAGAPMDDPAGGSNAGTARVVSGRTGAILFTFGGDSAGDQFGGGVRIADDVNLDGYADVVVGARADDNTASGAGSVRIFSGRDGVALYTFDGDSAGDALGVSVGAGGDLNGDGFPDVIAGATGDDNGGTGAGSARAWSLVPAGVTSFGVGTPGCDGAQSLTGVGVPSVGNANFELVGYPGPANQPGYLVVTDAADGPGSDPLGVGAIFHLALPPAASFFVVLPSTHDANGSYRAPVPIPNVPAFASFIAYFQHFSIWPQPCVGLGAFNLSSSAGARVTIQP